MKRQPDRRFIRRRRLVIALLTVAVLLPVALLYWAYETDRRAADDSGRPGSWMSATAEQVADLTRVPVPAFAVDVRWGHQNGFQYDLGVQSFRLPSEQTGTFRDGLAVAEWRASKPLDPGTDDGLVHIGAPDPRTEPSMTCGLFESRPPGHVTTTSVCLAPWSDGTSQIWVSAVRTP
ncbi:hypothetical protein [Kitasatospora purpeofusca]|uniref:hypothetical protein n=1 Tax=Kitasatospora purpeofusca TaxID=67352 RepID=UPI0036520345